MPIDVGSPASCPPGPLQKWRQSRNVRWFVRLFRYAAFHRAFHPRCLVSIEFGIVAPAFRAPPPLLIFLGTLRTTSLNSLKANTSKGFAVPIQTGNKARCVLGTDRRNPYWIRDSAVSMAKAGVWEQGRHIVSNIVLICAEPNARQLCSGTSRQSHFECRRFAIAAQKNARADTSARARRLADIEREDG